MKIVRAVVIIAATLGVYGCLVSLDMVLNKPEPIEPPVPEACYQDELAEKLVDVMQTCGDGAIFTIGDRAFRCHEIKSL